MCRISSKRIIVRIDKTVLKCILLQITIILFYEPPRYFKATENGEKKTD
jgi:hypothetical protein